MSSGWGDGGWGLGGYAGNCQTVLVGYSFSSFTFFNDFSRLTSTYGLIFEMGVFWFTPIIITIIIIMQPTKYTSPKKSVKMNATLG